MNIQGMEYKPSPDYNPKKNMNFSYKSIYNRLIQKVVHKGGKSGNNYINIFQNSKALTTSVGNIHSDYQLIHTFL